MFLFSITFALDVFILFDLSLLIILFFITVALGVLGAGHDCRRHDSDHSRENGD